MTRLLPAFSVLAATLAIAPLADAQPLGTFRWQLQPYCNIVSVSVTQNGGVYRLEGTDDQCGAGNVSASAIGTAFTNPSGSIGFGLNIVAAPGGASANVDATIAIATLNGTWRDGFGNNGTFVFTPGAGTGGVPRPLRATGAGPVTGVLAGHGLARTEAGGVVTLGIPATTSGGYRLDSNGGLLSSGTFNLSSPIPTSGPGTRFMWYPGKAALRAGNVVGTQWDNANVGNQSVAFGANTTASGFHSVAMGDSNQATGSQSVALGHFTAATGARAFSMGDLTVAGGADSIAVGLQSQSNGAQSVAMGLRVFASGNGSIVLGSDAAAQAAASGTFIFSDRSTTSAFVGWAPNEFLVRAAGGVGFYTNAALTTGLYVAANGSQWLVLSDANTKHLFRDLDGETVLAQLARMPVREWSYLAQDASIRHVGPTAQDFHAAFGLGEDPLRIGTMDADGIALAAVRALEARTRELRDENARLSAENEAIRNASDELRARLERLERTLNKQ